jgi:hypothetical protein
MYSVQSLGLACLAALIWCTSASSEVHVAFVHPESYSDVGRYGSYGARERDAVLRDLRQHLEHLGERYLKPHQVLQVEVLDIDLAGHYEPWRVRAYDVRILRGVTWPRIKVRYVWQEDGRILASAEESIADLHYLWQPAASYTNDSLRYEKVMLDEWFHERFVAGRPPRN